MVNGTQGYKVLQDTDDMFRLDEETGGWIADGSVHLKAVSVYGDPVELNSTQARLLARALLRFADKLDEELDIEPS